MNIDVDKLEEIFLKRHEELRSKVDASDTEFYINWCDKHEVFILHPEWLRETINEGLGEKVCIHSPEGGLMWLLVPRKLAEKTLVLGYIA